MNRSKIVASVSTKVLGTYEGECADANITNANGLDITRPVWENVFNSDEYKKALELGWYIGYLGHPEDPNCMDFKDACIVMTEGHISSDGKVYGKFNLIDTPVGRIVAAFQEAGVTFGISVRGAGDIVDNSVDPDTFIFRGFDLVTFPAYPESIPKFTEVAASTNIEDQRRYSRVCSAVSTNLEDITSAAAIDTLKKFFAPQSKEFAALEKRRSAIVSNSTFNISAEKLDAMTALYASEREKTAKLEYELHQLKSKTKILESQQRRKLASVQRITSAQIADLDEQLAISASELSSQISKNRKLTAAHTHAIQANRSLKKKNLKYIQEITANTQLVSSKTDELSAQKSKLRETVMDKDDAERRASNLEARIAAYRSDINAANQIIEEYQNAYASIYANAVGADLGNIQITATTTVSDLQKMINASACAPSSTTVPDEDMWEDGLIAPESENDLVVL